jgi:hypothetical protein
MRKKSFLFKRMKVLISMGGKNCPSRGTPFVLPQGICKARSKQSSQEAMVARSQEAMAARSLQPLNGNQQRAMAAKSLAITAPNAKEATQAKAAPQAKEASQAMETQQVESNPDLLSSLPPFQRLRMCISWWEKYAPQFVLNLISKGVEPMFPKINLPRKEQKKSKEENELATKVMMEYVEAKAAREIQMAGTKYLVPWFVIRKMEANGKEKLRLISDCREVNKVLNPPRFKLDHWKDIFPQLEKGMWATKVDLKNAYFHLQLSEAIKPYIRMKIGEKIFQMEGACFGLSTLPYLWMEVMNVFLKKWRKQGLRVFVYLDDILLVSRSKTLAEKQTSILMKDLEESGMTINFKKSTIVPSQQVEHLGFYLDLEQGLLKVPTAKLKSVRKELGKFLTQKEMSCRKAAAILGQIRSFLTALPCLRAFTDLLVKFSDQHKNWGWDKKHPINQSLKDQVVEIGALLKNWEGRSLDSKSPVRKIYSDSSTEGWGALDLTSGQKLQEFWRSEKGLHINIKELKASIAATQSLAKPGETVFLTIDNQVAYSYLKKEGGKLCHFNSLMRPFLTWCHQRKIRVVPNWVKSEEMLADGISRWKIDRGDYTLKKSVFQKICGIFGQKNFQPLVDMFASPGNAQLEKFVARWPHHQAIAVNSLECSLEKFTEVYANPPWKIILPWLIRLKKNPHLKCLIVIPHWVGMSWWPLLVKLHMKNFPVVQVQPQWGLFQNCLGEEMPPTRWPLLCLMLSGRAFKENKSRLKISHFI